MASMTSLGMTLPATRKVTNLPNTHTPFLLASPSPVSLSSNKILPACVCVCVSDVALYMHVWGMDTTL